MYSDNPLLPIQWLNDLTFVGVSNVRQAQVRYTYGFGGGLTGAFGVEAPYSDITTATGTSYPDSNGGSGIGWQYSPDFTGRLVWKQEWGLLALRGLVRPQIDLNNRGRIGNQRTVQQIHQRLWRRLDRRGQPAGWPASADGQRECGRRNWPLSG